MFGTVLGALLPVVVTILVGFLAARNHSFDAKQAAVLNRMVLLYAVPMGLFAGTVSTRREILTRDTLLVITLSVATIGFYVLIFLISRFVFRAQLGFSAMAALAASAPAVPFIGPAVLGDLFGTSSAIPVGIGSVLILVRSATR